jgi:hypothetical protein
VSIQIWYKEAGFELKIIWREAVMDRVQTKQTLKLRLLAFVLALAILWYSLNPVPTPIIQRKREDEPPDEKKRSVEPQRLPMTLPVAFKSIGEIAEPLPFPDEDEDDFEWPEFING